ncbi:MAG: hypothetical protein DRR11_20995, partial [Gammaproteobacteria bacterium]
LTGPFARFLQQHIGSKQQPVATVLADVSATVSDVALEAIGVETAHLICRVIEQNRAVFSPSLPLPPGKFPVLYKAKSDLIQQGSYADRYVLTKRLEGEILEFTTRVQKESLQAEDTEKLGRLLLAIREAVHSAKSLKDVRHNLDEFQTSGNHMLNEYLDHFRGVMIAFHAELFALRREDADEVSFENLVETAQSIRQRHDDLHTEIFSSISAGTVHQAEMSSLLNVNREILNANLALVNALSFYYLDAATADAFSRLPGVT